MKGHELDEVRTRPNAVQTNLSHNSPDVIFREHNRLATLPGSAAPVKKFFKTMRTWPIDQGAEQEQFFKPFGLQYGESPRLSRHARRRMVESLERRSIAAEQPYARPAH